MIIIFILVFLILIFIVISLALTYRTLQSPNQAVFEKGIVPDPKMRDFYRGYVPKVNLPWRGKMFNHNNSMGINVFDYKTGTYEKYPFRTYVGQSIQEREKFVLKLDYDIDENPFWVRWVLDEVVQIDKDKFLGKIHLKLIPGLPFSLGFFWLKKED